MMLDPAPANTGDVGVGDQVRVCLDPDCIGGDSPHFPAEDGAEGKITDYQPGGDLYFVLFEGRPVRTVMAGQPKMVFGRQYAVAELQLLGTDRV